jgi:phage/plasmid-associated DNA primase
VREVIAADDKDPYDYVMRWFGSIIQHHGEKTEAALILKGLQGCGKNGFTNVLSHLVGRYAKINVTTIDELTGIFNSIV